MMGCRGGVSTCIWLLAAVAAVATVHARQDPPPETQQKAAFLTKFPQFVEWPAETWRVGTRVLICVVRPTRVSRPLQQLVGDETLNGRPLAVREIDFDDPIGSCQVLFIGGAARPGTRILLRRASVLPVLTVGERPAFLEDGGIVNLQVIDGRVRFDVNPMAADRVHLRLSSQLLRLARQVMGARPS